MTTKLKADYSEQINSLANEIESADTILIGAGAGLSTASGFHYDGERFEKYFSDFHQRYGIKDMYSGGFYPYETLEEYWAWWSRHIFVNRYDTPIGKPYADLLEIVQDKDYFILTTNVDHQFQIAGFDKKRLFYTQGDYGLLQCSKACHDKTYDNEDVVRRMLAEQKNLKIPSELIPKCHLCGAPMTMNLRCDHFFVQDEGWYAAASRYEDFIRRHKGMHILFLELGVGGNTPGIIKYPFWQMTAKNPKAVYACINHGEACAPREIRDRSICINADIGKILEQL
ncbi:MAG: Sir2 silent information regulator family NAD-dependent deacetylase [Lachnospiraceae bacterium]|nr:Sir2 silent information regulator family NAD-dependent deacetylase [Lachnospiraceae bacterium]